MKKILCCALLLAAAAAVPGSSAIAGDNSAAQSNVVKVATHKGLVEPTPPKRGSWDSKECVEEAGNEDGEAAYRLCCTFTYSNPTQVVEACGPWHKVEKGK